MYICNEVKTDQLSLLLDGFSTVTFSSFHHQFYVFL